MVALNHPQLDTCCRHAYITTLRKLGWGKVAALTQDGAKYSNTMAQLQDEFQNNQIQFIINRKVPMEATNMSLVWYLNQLRITPLFFQYLRDLKDRGAKIIIGDFHTNSARHILCEAYKAEMTQQQGFVWFLPGWFEPDWYDIDRMRRDKETKQVRNQTESKDKNGHSGTINMFVETEVGELPSCSTSEMILALDGHFSLVHANYAPDGNMVVGNRTVQEWKKEVKRRWMKTKEDYYKLFKEDSTSTKFIEKTYHLNKYSGYVYDAVWLYAFALHKLVGNQSNNSYIENWHSERTVKNLVNVIKNTSFLGVSGWINFDDKLSRLSNVRILQWLKNGSHGRIENEIGVYLPDYKRNINDTTDSKNRKMKKWNPDLINWQTTDGLKPLDNPKECGILSAFATKLDVDCQLAITFVFIINFSVLLLIICVLFLVFRRR